MAQASTGLGGIGHHLGDRHVKTNLVPRLEHHVDRSAQRNDGLLDTTNQLELRAAATTGGHRTGRSAAPTVSGTRPASRARLGDTGNPGKIGTFARGRDRTPTLV